MVMVGEIVQDGARTVPRRILGGKRMLRTMLAIVTAVLIEKGASECVVGNRGRLHKRDR